MRADMIAVVGAAGEVGSWFVRCLSRRGEAVRAVHRGPPSADLARFPLDVRYADLRDAAALDRALDGARVVVNCAIDKRHGGSPRRSLRDNVLACERLVSACARHGGRRLIHLSSIVALPPRVTPAVVSRPFEYSREQDWYSRVKVATERRMLAARARLDVCVIRPGIVYGPYMAWSRVAFSLARGRRIALPDPATSGSRCHAVYAGDLVRLVHHCAGLRGPLPALLYAVNPERVSWPRFYGEHAAAIGLCDPVELGALPVLERHAASARPALAPRLLRWVGASPLLDPVHAWPAFRRLKAAAKAYVPTPPPRGPGRAMVWPTTFDLAMYRSDAEFSAAQSGEDLGFSYRMSFAEGCRAAADSCQGRWADLTAAEAASVRALLEGGPTR